MTKKKILLTILMSLAFLAVPVMTLAAPSIDTGSLGSTGLSSGDLKATVVKIVNYVLGLLALVAVIMILWGGFTWLTAAGNEEKVEKAKEIISAAVIGIVIILLAWAIVNFVLSTATNVTA